MSRRLSGCLIIIFSFLCVFSLLFSSLLFSSLLFFFIVDRLVLASETHLTAFIVSPHYNHSKDWYRHCLKFRYMLHGPGARQLTVYQTLEDNKKRPVWTANKTTLESSWKYGQVPLAAVSGYTVSGWKVSDRKMKEGR